MLNEDVLKCDDELLQLRQRTPILVLTYKNNALDQFLKGTLDHTKNLVRVGGGSKDEALEDYNLRNHLRRNETQEKRKAYFIVCRLVRIW